MTRNKKKSFAAIIAFLLCALCCWQGAAVAFADEEVRYTDGGISTMSYANNIYYTSRTQVDYNITDGFAPTYLATGTYTNACGAIAGANTIGFFDKYVPNLIPEWVSYYPTNGRYRAEDTVYIPAVIAELYTRMRTNVDDVGVSESDFLNGLEEFVEVRNFDIMYTSLFSGGQVNYSGCKSFIDNNKPILVFMDPTEMVLISQENGYDYVTGTTLNSAHIALIFGYERIRYTLLDGSTLTKTYLIMSTGQSSPTIAYLDISTSVDINDVKGVYIY